MVEEGFLDDIPNFEETEDIRELEELSKEVEKKWVNIVYTALILEYNT